MHLIPYAFLLMVGVLGLLMLTTDPETGFRWMGYTGAGRSSVDIGLVRVLGGVLVVLAVLPLFKKRR